MLDGLAPLTIASRMGLAVAMAVFMGLAFEGVYKRERPTRPGGIRTFPMLAVLGAILYLIEPKSLLPFVVGLAALALWLYAYIRAEPVDDPSRPGLMVPAASLLAYAFGPAAILEPPWLVIAAAVAAVLLLESREALHRLVLKVPSDEVFTLGKFLILIGIILPLVPNRPIGPWTPITPFNAWLALVAVSSLSYASYLLQRYLPRKTAALWPAILGGAYSSTATTVALAREQKGSAARSDLAAGIVIATAIMYVRIYIVVAIFNARLAWVLLPALAGLSALAGCTAAWVWWRRPREAASSPAAKLPAVNPLGLGTAATFAALFVVLTVASTWARATFGARGVYTVAALTGLTDIDPFVLSLAQGAVAAMSVHAVGSAILIAASSNNVLKACYALAFGGTRACLRPALLLAALGAVGLGIALAYL